jgi:hypothetical protein
MEPISVTLAGVAGVALTEGVKFLYAQAGELLRRWHEKRERPDDDRPALDVQFRLPPAFEGQIHPATVAPDVFAQNESSLAEGFQRVSLYATGVKPMDASDPELLKRADELRGALERILGQTITFNGEQRPTSGTPVVRGTFNAETVSGEAAGIRATVVRSGLVEGKAEVKSVPEGGKVYGTKVDTIG